MNYQPKSYIAGTWLCPDGPDFNAWDPNTDQPLPSCSGCSHTEVGRACDTAQQAFAELAQKTGADVAVFLRAIADEIEQLGDLLITTAQTETALPSARLVGERARTCGQIRAFAAMADDESWRQPTIDTADPEREPLPKPDVRALLNPLGPVAVFGASNFPFAFGTLGGDTASALAAGNPVVVKGHPSHPMTSTLFAQAVDKAIARCQFPVGTFALLQGQHNELGSSLVQHPNIKAVGFTGSGRGGRALMDIAASRPEPIPVYAEMGSINPVFVMPDALEQRLDELAAGLAASINMGVGQFCTSPGLVVTLRAGLTEALANQLDSQPRGQMLNPGIGQALQDALTERVELDGLELVCGGPVEANSLNPHNTLMRVDADRFLSASELMEEVFGPASLVVECDSVKQMLQVANHLRGNLTATIHTLDYDNPDVETLLRQLQSVAGRVLFNGYPTGVEVCAAMQHGGPYPASSFAATTSVGTAAALRFTQRNAYQNCPDALLPAALRNRNPLGVWRRVDGELVRNAIGER